VAEILSQEEINALLAAIAEEDDNDDEEAGVSASGRSRPAGQAAPNRKAG